MSSVISKVISSTERSSDVISLWGCSTAVAAGIFVVSRWIPNHSAWITRVLWLVAAYLFALCVVATWRALRHGSAQLRLDAAPSTGAWLSGTIEGTRMPARNPALHIECTKASVDVDGAKSIHSVPWRSITLLDRDQISASHGQITIPFAVWIPFDAPPTSTNEEFDIAWTIRLEARPYVKTFQVTMRPAAAATSPLLPSSTPPRITPALPASLFSEVPLEDGRSTIEVPFPLTSFSLALLFLALAICMAIVLPRTTAVEVRLLLIGGFSFLSLFTFFVVAKTPRRVEVEGEELRIRCGLMGMGFHSRIVRTDVVRVEETVVDNPPAVAFYGVHLHTRSRRLHVAATRLKDPFTARAIAAAIESALRRSGDA